MAQVKELAERGKGLGNRGLALIKVMVFYAKNEAYKKKFGLYPLEEFFLAEADVFPGPGTSRRGSARRVVTVGEELMKWFGH